MRLYVREYGKHSHIRNQKTTTKLLAVTGSVPVISKHAITEILEDISLIQKLVFDLSIEACSILTVGL